MSSVHDAVQDLDLAGHGKAEIARRLGLAFTTVSHHLEPLVEAQDPSAETDSRRSDNRSPLRRPTRDRFAELLATGLSRATIARELGVSKATVSYHARRLGASVDARLAGQYDWAVIQSYYDLGHSVRDGQQRFGFSDRSWSAAVF